MYFVISYDHEKLTLKLLCFTLLSLNLWLRAVTLLVGGSSYFNTVIEHGYAQCPHGAFCHPPSVWIKCYSSLWSKGRCWTAVTTLVVVQKGGWTVLECFNPHFRGMSMDECVMHQWLRRTRGIIDNKLHISCDGKSSSYYLCLSVEVEELSLSQRICGCLEIFPICWEDRELVNLSLREECESE